MPIIVSEPDDPVSSRAFDDLGFTKSSVILRAQMVLPAFSGSHIEQPSGASFSQASEKSDGTTALPARIGGLVNT
jgi:hypothetical protein